VRTRLLLAALLLAAAAPRAVAQVDTVSPGAAALERQLRLRPSDAATLLALAREYEAAGRRDRAEATLRTGAARSAGDASLRGAWVELLARMERWSDALAAIAPLAARDSAVVRVAARLRVNAGLAAYRAGNRAAARAHWSRALREDPGLAEAAVDLGGLLVELGERDEARAVVERALAHRPGDARLLALRASTMDGPEGLAAAIAALRRLRAQEGGESTGLELAKLLTAAGDRVGAIALYDSLVQAPTASGRAFREATAFWLDGAQWETASRVAERGLDRFGTDGELWAQSGEALAGRADWRGAALAYRRAAGLLPRPEEAELPLLDAYVAAGDTAAALAVVRGMRSRSAGRGALLEAAAKAQALGAAPLADSCFGDLIGRSAEDAAALEGAAGQALARRDTAQALTLYRRAAAQDSSGPLAPLMLLRLERPPADSAARLLRRALWRGVEALQAAELGAAGAMSGPLSARRAARARPLLDRREVLLAAVRTALDTAVFGTPWGAEELRQLRLAYPQSSLLERYEARLVTRFGRAEEAVEAYDRLVRRSPEDADLQRERAETLQRAGRVVEAAEGYARALDLEPESEPAFRALLRLRQAAGTLDALLRQVRRQRVAFPDSRVLPEREIELLQRMGRLDEAADVARRLREQRP
jgi:tetratricopeptide (TPR) repeat protein